MINLKNIKIGLRSIVKPSILKETPHHATFEVTTHCNLNCKMCYRADHIKNPRHISIDRYKYALNEVRPQTVSIVGAGEPLLHPEIDKIIVHAKKRGLRINMTSNGTLLKKMAEKLVQSGLDLLNISIDSANPETYRQIRKSDQFNVIMEGVELLHQIKKKTRKDTPALNFRFCLLQNNTQDIKTMIKLAEKNHVETVIFHAMITFGREDSRSELNRFLEPEKLRKELMVANELALNAHVNTNIQWMLKHFNALYYRDWNKEKYPPCFYPWYTLYMNSDGRIQPCCYFAGQCTNIYFGNIYENRFRGIYNSPEFINFRKRIRNGYRDVTVCRECVPLTFWQMVGSSNLFPFRYFSRY